MSAVLSIDKKQLRQSFSAAVDTYDGLASLQRMVGLALLAKYPVEGKVDKLVDIGCGTGFLTQELINTACVGHLVAVDIALTMLQYTRKKIKPENEISFICADAEILPILNHSVDTIISNLAIQWCQNLTAVFDEFQRVLIQEGRLIFSTFGTKTLYELKQSWADVDDYDHVNEFYSVNEILNLLQQSGFVNIKVESSCYQSSYASVIDLMRELKGIGAHNILSGRNRMITGKQKMQSMFEAYETYRINGSIPATYEVIFVSAELKR